MPLLPLLRMLLATMLVEELSMIEMPLVPLLFTVTGRATGFPPRSWPTRRYDDRTARRPSFMLFRAVLFVTMSEAEFAAAAPRFASWMTQLSTSRVLP